MGVDEREVSVPALAPGQSGTVAVRVVAPDNPGETAATHTQLPRGLYPLSLLAGLHRTVTFQCRQLKIMFKISK